MNESNKEFLELGFVGYDGDDVDPVEAKKKRSSKKKSKRKDSSKSQSSPSTRRMHDSSTSRESSSRRMNDSYESHSSQMNDSSKSSGSRRQVKASHSFQAHGSSRKMMKDTVSSKSSGSRRQVKASHSFQGHGSSRKMMKGTMSELSLDMGSFHKDTRNETQATSREEDEGLTEDMAYLNTMLVPDSNMRHGDSKTSLKIDDLSMDHSDHNPTKEKRPSIVDRFKTMYASHPGHFSPRRTTTDPRGCTTRQASDSSMMARSIIAGGSKNNRRPSLLIHMQELFQGAAAADEDEGGRVFEDLVVDEEKQMRFSDKTTRKSVGNNSNDRRKLVISIILWMACLAATTGVFVLVLHMTDTSSANVETDSEKAVANPANAPGPMIPLAGVTTAPTSSPQEATNAPIASPQTTNPEIPVPPPQTSATETEIPIDSLAETSTPADKLDTFQIPTESRRDALRFLILDQHTTIADELKRIDSPANLALDWITETDPAQLGIPGYDEGHDTVDALRAVLQRYALAAFYFSQEAGGTSNDATTTDVQRQARLDMDLKWTTGHPVCEWPGITCDDNGMAKAVNLSSSLLEGFLPQEMLCGAALPALTSLDLSHNKLLGNLPPIHPLPASSAVGVIPPVIPLTELRLNHNHFKGSMSNLMGLEELKILVLSGNQIAGRIPETLSSLTKLTTFDVKNNDLSGNLSTFEGLSNLETLYLDANQFGGPIPPQWSALTKLKSLSLGHNEDVTGTIPSSLWAQLTDLRSLNLRETDLLGTIPMSLSKMTALERLYLHGTSLSGPMPAEICLLRAPQGPLIELTSNCDEQGSVACNCCTDCFWG